MRTGTRGLCSHQVSVRQSVRPSVTWVYCNQIAEDIVKLLCRPSSLIVLVFLAPSADIQFQGEPRLRGANYTGVENLLRFSTEIIVYLGNGTRYAHGYCGTLIVSHLESESTTACIRRLGDENFRFRR